MEYPKLYFSQYFKYYWVRQSLGFAGSCRGLPGQAEHRQIMLDFARSAGFSHARPDTAKSCWTLPDSRRPGRTLPTHAGLSRICRIMHSRILPDSAGFSQTRPDTANSCWIMPVQARVHWTHLDHAGLSRICRIMPDSARFCWVLPDQAEHCQLMLDCPRVKPSTRDSAGSCWITPGLSRIMLE